MDELIFPPGSVPVAVAAKVFGKDANWVRTGIVMGWLPIGTATRHGKTGHKVGRNEQPVRENQLLYFSEKIV